MEARASKSSPESSSHFSRSAPSTSSQRQRQSDAPDEPSASHVDGQFERPSAKCVKTRDM